MNQLDCVISYFFQLHLVLHACVRKLDVTGTVQNSLETKRCHNENILLFNSYLFSHKQSGFSFQAGWCCSR